MGMRVSMPSQARFLRTSGVRSFFSAVDLSLRCAGTLDLATRPGLVREEWRKVPPVRPARSTVSSSRRTKLSPVKRFLGRAKPEICFLQRSDAKIWRLQLGYDLCAEDHEEFGEPGVERWPGRAGDQVAVSDGIGHGEIDISASRESNVRAGGRIGAALLSFKDSSGSENLRGVTDGGEGLIGL